MVADAHGVQVAQVAGQVAAHLPVALVQRLDVLHPRQAQLALLHLSVGEDHAQEEQVGRRLRHELHPRHVE